MKQNYNPGNIAIQDRAQVTSKSPDTRKLIAVEIEPKLIVFAPKGAEIEVFKKNWIQAREGRMNTI